MFSSNPFAELSAWIPTNMMQGYVLVMIFLVVAGTLYDVVHKKSARYFRENMKRSRANATQAVGAGTVVSLAVKTAVVDVALSGEFCNQRRRIAHLLTMYGFLLFVISTALMIFCYPTVATPTPAILPQLWWLGGLMVCVGGYWFWFFIRVDVLAEGKSPFRIMRADLFILSLLATTTFALIWAWLQADGSGWSRLFFGLFILAATLLFGSVPWSKFAHMFFKPAAALEKRISAANGTRSNLPPPADKPARFGSTRQMPKHY